MPTARAPALRPGLAARVRALLELPSTLLADVEPTGERLLVRSNPTGSMQVSEFHGGRLEPRTALPEPVASARYVPGRRQAVIAVDRGGDERHGLYLLELGPGGPVADVEALTALAVDPAYVHLDAGVSPDGDRLAYVSNRADGVDFDLWLCAIDGGQHRLLHRAGAWLQPASGFSPDGRFVSVQRPGDRPLDVELVLVDVVTGETVAVLPHPDEAASVGAPAWIDPATFYVAANVGRDFAGVLRYDLGAAAAQPLDEEAPRHDAEVAASADGSTLLAESRVAPEAATVESFDGESVPVFVYRPAGAARPPAVVLVHGGPESQAVQAFDPVVQALVLAGLGVVVPNVRGSTGYGKRYAALDDTVRRLDSVRDLAAVHGALSSFGLDPGRAALMGGSYGGFMVLAGLAFQPELWSAGVDIVGISDLVTFLANTSDYRRAHREREYGSLEHDRDFLARASPLRSADRIRAPLFVIHGRNDPRVPVSEAEQLVANLARRGIRCELLIYENEGHGLARRENRLDAYPRVVAFLADVLGA